ncbi:hypothetical protein [Paraburkholderia sp. HD33-4]|uniref:hypothetical protein n=1 Tax=Paraburkholderia sp. HD33-4 TaxID=2883242 RepID=UPI001F43451C|nr:hypothetical protein [Paraburkholderia sp. HD33-4]
MTQRSRTVKGKFFSNESLGMMPPIGRLLFIGLWTLADRAGRLEDRPARIAAELFAYDHDVDGTTVDMLLATLDREGLIVRYEVNGARFIEVVKWTDHQHPHPREVESVIPPSGGQRRHTPTHVAGAPGQNLSNGAAAPTQHVGNAKDMPKDIPEPVPGNTKDMPKDMPGHDQGMVEPGSVLLGPSVPSGAFWDLQCPSGPSEAPPLRSTLSPAHSLEPRTKKNARGERLADGWQLPPDWGQWAMRECGMTRDQVADQALRFADYWHAKPGQLASKLDWLATWRNWCRKARDEGAYRVTPRAAALGDARRRTARAFGVGPRDRDVIDLPEEDCHVVPKH